MILQTLKMICTVFLHNNHQILSYVKNMNCDYYVRIPVKYSITQNQENVFDINNDYTYILNNFKSWNYLYHRYSLIRLLTSLKWYMLDWYIIPFMMEFPQTYNHFSSHYMINVNYIWRCFFRFGKRSDLSLNKMAKLLRTSVPVEMIYRVSW